jgi:hypothetical protein
MAAQTWTGNRYAVTIDDGYATITDKETGKARVALPTDYRSSVTHVSGYLCDVDVIRSAMLGIGAVLDGYRDEAVFVDLVLAFHMGEGAPHCLIPLQEVTGYDVETAEDGTLPARTEDGYPLAYYDVWGNLLCHVCANEIVRGSGINRIVAGEPIVDGNPDEDRCPSCGLTIHAREED